MTINVQLKSQSTDANVQLNGIILQFAFSSHYNKIASFTEPAITSIHRRRASRVRWWIDRSTFSFSNSRFTFAQLPIEAMMILDKEIRSSSGLIHGIIFSTPPVGVIINHMMLYDRLITFLCAFKILTFTVFIARPANCLIVNRSQSKRPSAAAAFTTIPKPFIRAIRAADEEWARENQKAKRSALSFIA